MSTERILEDYQRLQGWSDATALALALDYIENQQSPECWDDFLAQRSADEQDAKLES